MSVLSLFDVVGKEPYKLPECLFDEQLALAINKRLQLRLNVSGCAAGQNLHVLPPWSNKHGDEDEGQQGRRTGQGRALEVVFKTWSSFCSTVPVGGAVVTNCQVRLT